MRTRFHRFQGPSIFAPFPAICAELADPGLPDLELATAKDRCKQLGLYPSWQQPRPSPDTINLETLTGEIALHLQYPEKSELGELLITKQGSDPKTIRLFLNYLDADTSKKTLQAAINIASTIFSGFNQARLEHARKRIEILKKELVQSSPQSDKEAILAVVAKTRQIPIYTVAKGSGIYQFGQGCKSRHIMQTACDHDSWAGGLASSNKAHSNLLVTNLGFPGVEHRVAKSSDEALEQAAELGYPVVVKPVIGLKGLGVSAWIVDNQELLAAFEEAQQYYRQGVIVEKRVEGNNHRLTVIGGQLMWAETQYPATVIGNGYESVKQLIEAENTRRSQLQNRLKQIKTSKKMLHHIKRQGHSLETTPDPGESVALLSTSNIASGGTWEDVTDNVHPDNRTMAETIARAFRLHAAGIDFITPDISTSWRDIPSAIIEVNGVPGYGMETDHAQKILDSWFPPPTRGRVPSLLLIDPTINLSAQIFDLIKQTKRMVGITTDNKTIIAGSIRCKPDASLDARAQSLLRDPTCEGIIIEAKPLDLMRDGLPLDLFDIAIHAHTLPDRLGQLLKSCCTQVVELTGQEAECQEIRSILTEAGFLY